jgi:LPXTG-motif cell wall-anchored protein
MRIQRVAALLGVATLSAAAVAPSAVAQEYPPPSPTRAAGVCVGDIPFFAYEVDFGSDDFVGQPMTITFVNPSGDDFVIPTTVPGIGEPAAVLWPGASEDPEDWPGWELNSEGIWVETTEDTGAFTRAPGGVTVEFETNPTLTTSVTYPPATEACANPQQGPSGQGVPTTVADEQVAASAAAGATTPQTGADPVLPITLGLLGLGLGTALVLLARRRA